MQVRRRGSSMTVASVLGGFCAAWYSVFSGCQMSGPVLPCDSGLGSYQATIIPGLQHMVDPGHKIGGGERVETCMVICLCSL